MFILLEQERKKDASVPNGFRDRGEAEEYLRDLEALKSMTPHGEQRAVLSDIHASLYHALNGVIPVHAEDQLVITGRSYPTLVEMLGGADRANDYVWNLIPLMTHGPEQLQAYFFNLYIQIGRSIDDCLESHMVKETTPQAEQSQIGIKNDDIRGRVTCYVRGLAERAAAVVARVSPNLARAAAGLGVVVLPHLAYAQDNADSDLLANETVSPETIQYSPTFAGQNTESPTLQDDKRLTLDWLIPDHVYSTFTYSFKGDKFLSTAHKAMKSQVEQPLSLALGQQVDVKEWSDSDVPIVTPGLALGWDINDIWELSLELSGGKADLETKGSSAHSYIMPGFTNVDTGPASYKFNIARESFSVGIGPVIHVGDLINRINDKNTNWLGRGRFDPYLLGVLTYNWSSSDFEADVHFYGADISSQLGFPPGSAVIPATHERVRQHNTGRGFGYALGFGANFPLTQTWDLTTTVRWNSTHLDGRGGIDFDLNQPTIAIGIVIPLGEPRYGPGRDRWNLIGAIFHNKKGK